MYFSIFRFNENKILLGQPRRVPAGTTPCRPAVRTPPRRELLVRHARPGSATPPAQVCPRAGGPPRAEQAPAPGCVAVLLVAHFDRRLG